MTNSLNPLGTRPSAFVSEQNRQQRSLTSDSSADQKTKKVFCATEILPNQERGSLSGSPFRTIHHERPSNPHVPEIGSPIRRLSGSKSEFLVRVEELLNLFSSQAEEAIRNGMDSFLEGDITFNQEVDPAESSSQEVVQMRSDPLANISNILRFSKKMIGDQKSKLEALDGMGHTENQKIQEYVTQLRKYSVGYMDPGIQAFIEEQKNLDPQSPLILGLERANIENEKVNQAYHFLRMYMQYDM